MEFEVTESETNVPNPGPEAFVARLVASSRRGTTAEDVVVGMVKPLKKPTEPDFSVDEDI